MLLANIMVLANVMLLARVMMIACAMVLARVLSPGGAPRLLIINIFLLR